MKKIIKSMAIVIGMVAIAALAVKGWFMYQHEYVCRQKVIHEVERFTREIIADNIEIDHSVFVSKSDYDDFKRALAQNYTLEITEWDGDGAAYTLLRFDSTNVYDLPVVPKKPAIPSCWGVDYDVKSVRKSGS